MPEVQRHDLARFAALTRSRPDLLPLTAVAGPDGGDCPTDSSGCC